MKVRYILGAPSTQKFKVCINEILKKNKLDKTKQILFITPEQFVLQAEQALIKESENKILMNIQVVSFKRLAYHIFSQSGVHNKPILDECAKYMILRKILNENSEKFVYFNNKSYFNSGIIEKISDSIQEFFKYNVTLDKIQETILFTKQEKNELLALKLEDLKLIFNEYINFLSKNYLENNQVLDVLCNLISTSKFLKDSFIWIYGFSGFTKQELNVISNLSKVVNQINIALNLNTDNINFNYIESFDPFYETKNTIKNLNEIVLKNKLILEKPLFLTENTLHKNDELKYLENNFFSYNAKPYLHEPQNIVISKNINQYVEIENVAKQIVNLVKNDNYMFKDIAVILGDPSYKNILNSIFDKYNISYFLDNNRSIENHILVELILSVLNIFIYNWNYEHIFRYLKTNFILNTNLGLTKDNLNSLENYVLMYGINGKKWKQKNWEIGFLKNSNFDIEEINKTKNIVIFSLKKLNFKNNEKYFVKDISQQIFDFLIDLNVLSTLEILQDKENKLFEENEFFKVNNPNEHIQTWNNVVLIFEKFVEVLGEEKLTIEEYKKVLEIGLKTGEIGAVPSIQDQVIIGDFFRTRLADIKIIFALSINEGIVPTFKSDDQLISDEEKNVLLKNNLELSPTLDRLLNQDYFFVYSLLSKASDKIFFSYITSDLTGKIKKNSNIINNIIQIFPKIKVISLDYNSFSINDIYSPNVTFEQIIKIFSYDLDKNKDINLIKDILSWFLINKKYKEKLIHLEKGILSLNYSEYINKNLVEKLYNKKFFLSSVSKLEKFTNCPFSYFLKYNLNVNERKLNKIDSLEIGNFYHNVLEIFSNKFFEKYSDFENLFFKQVDLLIEESIKEYLEQSDSYIYLDSQKNNYILKNIKRSLTLSIYSIIKNNKKTTFKPYGFEINFTNELNDYTQKNIFAPIKINLENNYKMFLTGQIDRLDLLESNNETYIEIFDYKSSDKNFNLIETYYGIQLQLLIYLDAFIKLNSISKNNKDLIPGGLFYLQIKDPIIKFQDINSKEKLQKSIEKLFQLKGVLNKNEHVINALNTTIEEIAKRKNKIFSSLTLVNDAQFDILRNLVNIVSKEIGLKITNGNIKIFPYKFKDKKGCDYCPYSSICNIELLENNFNNFKEIDKNEIWTLIEDKINKKNT